VNDSAASVAFQNLFIMVSIEREDSRVGDEHDGGALNPV
jgi:hypothetical protein